MDQLAEEQFAVASILLPTSSNDSPPERLSPQFGTSQPFLSLTQLRPLPSSIQTFVNSRPDHKYLYPSNGEGRAEGVDEEEDSIDPDRISLPELNAQQLETQFQLLDAAAKATSTSTDASSADERLWETQNNLCFALPAEPELSNQYYQQQRQQQLNNRLSQSHHVLSPAPHPPSPRTQPLLSPSAAPQNDQQHRSRHQSHSQQPTFPIQSEQQHVQSTQGDGQQEMGNNSQNFGCSYQANEKLPAKPVPVYGNASFVGQRLFKQHQQPQFQPSSQPLVQVLKQSTTCSIPTGIFKSTDRCSSSSSPLEAAQFVSHLQSKTDSFADCDFSSLVGQFRSLDEPSFDSSANISKTNTSSTSNTFNTNSNRGKRGQTSTFDLPQLNVAPVCTAKLGDEQKLKLASAGDDHQHFSESPKRKSTPDAMCVNGEKRIPRPPNAFMIFGQQNRKLLATQYPQYTNKQISKILGDEWRKMKTDEKSFFHRLADEAYAKHMKKYPGRCPLLKRVYNEHPHTQSNAQTFFYTSHFSPIGYYYSPLEARQRKADRKKKFIQKINSKKNAGNAAARQSNVSDNQSIDFNAGCPSVDTPSTLQSSPDSLFNLYPSKCQLINSNNAKMTTKMVSFQTNATKSNRTHSVAGEKNGRKSAFSAFSTATVHESQSLSASRDLPPTMPGQSTNSAFNSVHQQTLASIQSGLFSTPTSSSDTESKIIVQQQKSISLQQNLAALQQLQKQHQQRMSSSYTSSSLCTQQSLQQFHSNQSNPLPHHLQQSGRQTSNPAHHHHHHHHHHPNQQSTILAYNHQHLHSSAAFQQKPHSLQYGSVAAAGVPFQYLRNGQLLFCGHGMQQQVGASNSFGVNQMQHHHQHPLSNPLLTSVAAGFNAHHTSSSSMFASSLAIPPTIYHVTNKDPNLNSTMSDSHSPTGNNLPSSLPSANPFSYPAYSIGNVFSSAVAAAAAAAAAATAAANSQSDNTQSNDLNSLSSYLPPMDNPSNLITPVGSTGLFMDNDVMVEMMNDFVQTNCPPTLASACSPPMTNTLPPLSFSSSADPTGNRFRSRSPLTRPTFKWD